MTTLEPRFGSGLPAIDPRWQTVEELSAARRAGGAVFGAVGDGGQPARRDAADDALKQWADARERRQARFVDQLDLATVDEALTIGPANDYVRSLLLTRRRELVAGRSDR